MIRDYTLQDLDKSMNLYSIRKATKYDVDKIVEIYNSNTKFLINHLGIEVVDHNFIKSEMTEMDKIGFISCVIFDKNTDEIIGVIDYKPDKTVYLSLFMINSSLCGKGIGSLAYRYFEDNMLLSKKRAIRIDVVNDYDGNAIVFWRKQGFVPQKEIQLKWGNKKSNALVMIKLLG